MTVSVQQASLPAFEKYSLQSPIEAYTYNQGARGREKIPKELRALGNYAYKCGCSLSKSADVGLTNDY